MLDFDAYLDHFQACKGAWCCFYLVLLCESGIWDLFANPNVVPSGKMMFQRVHDGDGVQNLV